MHAQFAVKFLLLEPERFVVVEGQHAHLLGREPEREVARVMFDQEADEALVRDERRAIAFGVLYCITRRWG